MKNLNPHGRTFAAVRFAHGLSLEKMSKFLKVSISHLSRVEKGERVPGISMYQALENYMGISLSEIRKQFKRTA